MKEIFVKELHPYKFGKPELERPKVLNWKGIKIIVSLDDGKYHLSMSGNGRSPSYKEIKHIRYQLIPDKIYMAQIFPPADEFVNVHPHCHHLWEILPEK